MIPLLAVVRFRSRRNHSFGLWLPLFLAWLLLAPLVLLLFPIFFILCSIGKVNPFRAISTLWHVLTGMRGTNVEVAQNRTMLMVHIN